MSHPSTDQVWAWLDAIPDPEIPVISLVDLGIIRGVEWSGERLVVTVTPTYTGCPATATINEDIKAALKARGIGELELKQQLAPPWSTDWLSQKGRAKLEEFGIAPPQAKGVPARCPHCGASDVEQISPFGSTPCKAHWRCRACLEPFDYFKCI